MILQAERFREVLQVMNFLMLLRARFGELSTWVVCGYHEKLLPTLSITAGAL